MAVGWLRGMRGADEGLDDGLLDIGTGPSADRSKILRSSILSEVTREWWRLGRFTCDPPDQIAQS